MNAVVRLEPPITPRPDQLDALDAILDALDRDVRRPLVEAPCAWGKSVLIAMLALALVRRSQRVLILAHRHELLEQNTGALLRLDPAADVGICSASLRSDRLDAAIVVGGTATIFRRLQRLGRVDAVLLDECFPAGTLIDGRPIEIVRPGDIVRTFDSATGGICTGRVVRVFSRVCRTVAVLTFQSGRRVAATLNHPILTTKGWINAGTLAPGCDVYVDPMHRVRHTDTATKPAPLRVVESDGQSLLLSRMRPRCEAAKSRATFTSDEAAQSDVCGRPASEDAGDPPGNRPSAVNPWRERQATTATADDFVGSFGTGLDCRAFGPNLESPQAARNALALQDRHRASRIEDRHRDRWPEPQPQYQEAVGREEGCFLAIDRLVSAEVLERGRDVEFDAVCPGGLVYNFEVEGTHTYFAAGVAAHNCHLLGPGSTSMLGTILKALDDPPLIGFTATPFRTDSGSLVSADLFDEIVWRMGIIEAIDGGLLVPLITKSPKAGRIDTTYVPIERGEFQQRPLEQAALAGSVTRDAVVRTLQVAAEENRTAMLFFAIGVAHCAAISAVLREHGIRHAVITGDTPTEERAEAIARFRARKLPALVNCNVLTTGFDARNIDLIAFMRPTVSPVLWTQAAGRGMRTWPGKETCIAEGSLVLTDTGLVPIEHVTRSMRVWDGAGFVSHSGAVFKGEQNVISYAGLTATYDHNVWTKEGWQTFGKCARQQIPIAVTGVGGTPIPQARGCFSRGATTWPQPLPLGQVSPVWRDRLERTLLSDEGSCGVPQMRAPARGAQVAGGEDGACAAPVYEPDRPELGALWRARHTIPVPVAYGRCCVDCGEPGNEQGEASGPDRQQRPLRAGQSPVVYATTKPGPYAATRESSCVTRVSAAIPARQICGQHAAPDDSQREVLDENSRAVGGGVAQTKGRVWDILNAGPLHRFTVSGLLVHNCRLLDFGGNILRHGPINAIKLRAPGSRHDAQAAANRVRICPRCDEINEVTTAVCTSCGMVLIKPRVSTITTIESTAPAIDAQADRPRWVRVHTMRGGIHEKPGRPPSFRLRYSTEEGWVSEFLSLEHEKPGARWYARKAWTRLSRTLGAPPPASAHDAYQRFIGGELREPQRLRIERDGQWWRVVDVERPSP